MADVITKTVKIVELTDAAVAEIVTPKIERYTKEQLIAAKAETEKRLAFIDSVLAQFPQ